MWLCHFIYNIYRFILISTVSVIFYALRRKSFFVVHGSIYFNKFKVCPNSTDSECTITPSIPTSFLLCSGRSDSKESPLQCRRLGLIPGLGRSPGEGNGYPLQYSCLENSTESRAWWATYSPWRCRFRQN